MTSEETKPVKRTPKIGARPLMTAPATSTFEENGSSLNPRDYVSSLARGLEVLRAFNHTRRQMTLSEIAAETGNTRAGARRILLTLVEEGYAVTDGKLFDLTPQVLELGCSVLLSKGMWDVVRPFLNNLSEEIKESVSAAVLDKFEVVYVSGTQYNRIISVGVIIGARYPAHATATGRVLLSLQPEEMWPGILQNIPLTPVTHHTVIDRIALRQILEDVRQKGWCIVDQELEIGLASLAVPLRDNAGTLLGAINVSVPIVRTSVEEIEQLILPRLQDTAARIAQALNR